MNIGLEKFKSFKSKKWTEVQILFVKPSKNPDFKYNLMKNCFYTFLLLLAGLQNLQGQCLVSLNGNPPAVDTVCDVSNNDDLLWNNVAFWDPLTLLHNMADAPADLKTAVISTCTNLQLEAVLLLDLDQSGTTETAVSSAAFPAPGLIAVGKPFDNRPVAAANKYRFVLDTFWSADTLRAQLRWVTSDLPGATRTLPQLPYGKHRMEWRFSDGQGGGDTIAYDVVVRDCKAPLVVPINGLSVNIMPTQMIMLWASDFFQYTEDNHTPVNQLVTGIRRVGTGTGFPTLPNGDPQTGVVFNCDDLGTKYVEIWSKDKYGNAGADTTYVIVQDAGGFCSGATGDFMACARTACGNQLVGDVEFEITGSNPMLPPLSMFLTPGDTSNMGCATWNLPFSYPNLGVTPVKDDNPLNGVSTFDAVLTLKHILGLESFDAPYKHIAADVNNSKSVTSYDIAEMRKLILGIYDELPNNSSWRFYDADYVFLNPNNPFVPSFPETIVTSSGQTEFNFNAVKIGDVNCSAITNNFQNPPVEERMLTAPDLHLQAGETLEIPISVLGKTSWWGFQGSLQYDPAVLSVENITSESLGDFDETHWFEKTPGNINLSWVGENIAELKAGTPVVTLRIRAHASLSVREVLKLQTGRLDPEAYAQNGVKERLNLLFESTNVSVSAAQPNPGRDVVRWNLQLDTPSDVQLEMFDMQGKKVFEQNSFLAEGSQSVEARVTVAPGVYTWRMRGAFGSVSGKWIAK